MKGSEMAEYYVNQRAQSNGDHEVHRKDCNFLPISENRQYLGSFPSCHGAVQKAKEFYPTADGCKHCSPECHTR